MSSELKKLFTAMKKRFAKGVFDRETIFYFSLGEEEGQKWTVTVGPSKMAVQEGKGKGDADCVLKSSEEFFLKIARGEHKPGTMDFLRGKIKTSEPELLKKFSEMFL